MSPLDLLDNNHLPKYTFENHKQQKFESDSASEGEAFLRYFLEPESNKEFEETLYPLDDAHNKGLVKRDSFKALCEYLVQISAKLNFLTSTLCKENAHGTGDTFRQLVQISKESITDSKTAHENLADSVKKMVININSAKSFIIVPSTRKKDGFDIIYTGLPRSGAGHEAASHMNYTPSSYSNNERTPGIKERVDDIYLTLFGKKLGIADADKRISARLALDFDFTELDGVLNPVGVVAFDNLKMPDLLKGLKNNFKIVVTKEASNRVVATKLMARKSTNVDGTARVVNNEDILKDELEYLLDGQIRFSFVLSIPKDWAHFITQTKENEAISLMNLNTWATIWSPAAFRKHPGKQKKVKGEAPAPKVQTSSVPPLNKTARYVFSASHLTELANKRKELGLYTEPGRTNSEGIYINKQGRLNWCASTADSSPDVAKEYERRMEAALKLSFDAGSPLLITSVGTTAPVFELNSPGYSEKIRDVKDSIKTYSGQQIMYNWDYNTVVTINVDNPDRMNTIDLTGAAIPDELGLMEFLRLPFYTAMAQMFPGHGDASYRGVPSPFLSAFKMYEALEKRQIVPSFERLVAEAMEELNIKTLLDEKVKPYDAGLYRYITNEGVTNPILSEDQNDGRLFTTFMQAYKDSLGTVRTNLAKYVGQERTEISDDPHFVDPSQPLYMVKSMFLYVGGKVGELALRYLSKLKPKDLKPSEDVNESLPNATEINGVIMPLAIMLSNYVVNSDAVFAKSEELAAKLQPDETLQPEDLKFPGLNEDFKMFPHQFRGHQVLNNAPRFAFLDIAPGGGKTLELLTDIANLTGKNLIKRSIVFAPNRLVKNWCDDLLKMSKGEWNIIPLIVHSWDFWKEDRLQKMLENAPRNTIVVCGLKFLTARAYTVVIGGVAVKVTQPMEFIKKFKFDYVACDEAHRLKNPASQAHKMLKSIATASCVKYVRLATGSIIQNTLTDVVGQAAIMNSQMFKTPEEFKYKYFKEVKDRITGEVKMDWVEGAPRIAREILATQVAVLTAKRKDWAFMLPTPLENFVHMPLTPPGGAATLEVMYGVVRDEVLTELKKNKKLWEALTGAKPVKNTEEGEDDDDDDNGDLPDDGKAVAAGDKTDDNFKEDEEAIAELTALLDPYIARLEQMLTDPINDPLGPKYFEALDQENYISPKVMKVIDLLNDHFTIEKWEKGKKYTEWDFATSGGLSYQVTRPNLNYDLEQYVAVADPATDPRWVQRGKGKVLIFCRYIRSVEAIYRALPPALQKVAVKFTSKEKDGTANIAAFVASDKVQILIANEQAISEGFNFQMAGRLIRVETPWAPGELDQSVSRIFRPDPGNQQDKSKSREMIYLDWLVCDNTLEVPKMGRLISKMVSKAQFDENGNPAYDEIQKIKLPLIKMDLETLQSEISVDDITDDYIAGYQKLADVQSVEFREMKQRGITTMLAIPPTPMFADARKIDYVPYIPNQDIYDKDGLGLIKLNKYIEDNRLENNLQSIKGLYAHTEMGNGVIVDVTQMRKGVARLSSVKVQLAATGENFEGDPSVIFYAENLTAADLKKIKKMPAWASPADKRRAEQVAKRLAREQRRAEREAEKEAQREARRLEREQRNQPDDEEDLEAEPDEEQLTCSLYPVVYNGFMGLKAGVDEITLEDYGFTQFGEFAYIDCTKMNEERFDKLCDWLDDTFEIPAANGKNILRMLNHIAEYKKFKVPLLPITEFKNFYRLRHKANGKDPKTGKPILTLFPVITLDKVILKIDLDTNPKFRKYIGKVIPGVGKKFDSDISMEIWFAPNNTRNEVVRHIKELQSEGLIVNNLSEVKEGLEKMKGYKPPTKK